MESASIRSIKTDCECLTAIGVSSEIAGAQQPGMGFRYRSPNSGPVRITIWIHPTNGHATAAQYTVEGFVYDKAWIVTPDDIRDDPSAILVDTRWKQEFERVHIPRSVNLPAFALPARADLRDRRVVLIDGGFAPEQLLSLVQSLRSKGFREVVYLAGGLPAWLRSGGAHRGTSVSPLLEAATIEPSDFARARRYTAWQVVNVTTPSNGAWEAVDDRDPFTAGATALAQSRVLPRPTLVIAEKESSYASLERSAARMPVRSLYYLRGGAPAMVSFERMQEALVNRPAELFQTRIAAPRPLMGSGCGTCPNR
jgi:rhodanese-related sulfurtransferase